MHSQSAHDFHRRRQASLLQRREDARLEWLGRTREAIKAIAPNYPALQRVALFGSVVKTSRFHDRSDIDVAVVCTDVEQESLFWRALEQTLRRDVDVRPMVGPVAQAVQQHGEVIYG